MTTTDKPTGNAARIRLRLLAAFLPVTAALYVGAEALDPKGTDQVVTNTGVDRGVWHLVGGCPMRCAWRGTGSGRPRPPCRAGARLAQGQALTRRRTASWPNRPSQHPPRRPPPDPAGLPGGSKTSCPRPHPFALQSTDLALACPGGR